ncbi:MAG: hypothetical protein ACOYVF_13410 [Candidatus Zixiibacteriota bacterium]
MPKLFGVLLLVLVLANGVFADGINLSQAVDRTETAYESTVDFELTLSWKGPQSAYYFPQPLQPVCDRMKIQKFSSTISSAGTGDEEITTKKYKFTLKPTAAGMAYIQPVTISYVTWPDSIPGELVSEPMSVVVHDPVPVVEEEGLPITTIVIIIVAVIALAGMVSVALFLHAKKKPAVPVSTPKTKFLEALTGVKSEAGNNLKKFQTGLYKILLTYLEEEYHLELAGKPSQEIIEALNKVSMDGSQKGQISGWLMRAEKEKYSPVAGAPGETIRLESELRGFFEKI